MSSSEWLEYFRSTVRGIRTTIPPHPVVAGKHGQQVRDSMFKIPSVRLATPSDARAIANFSRDFIEYGLGWGYTEAKIIGAIQSTTTNVAVSEERGVLCAFGIMDYGDTSAHLVLLGVQPTDQRQGLGTHILHWLEQCAVTAGLERIRVEARVDNSQAIAFYQKHGYQVRKSISGYYRGILDAVRLEKPLGIISNELSK